MKNSLIFKKGDSLLKTPVWRLTQIALLFLFIAQFNSVHAQAKLSIQGILKKSSGDAVPDDTYTLTFRLYNNVNAPVASNIWVETQNDVDVASGIYSTVLGNVTPLNVPFNVEYYLGVAIGGPNSTEMTPRIQLTSAPYALSLRGSSNLFPSTGQVVADSIDVNGTVLAQMGAPGLNGNLHNGYAFLGDKDSGLFTTSANQVSLYVNNTEEVLVRPDSVVINGEVRPENLRFDAGGKISYNGLNDWRLVETDYFENVNDAEGWKIYSPTNGVQGAYSNGNGSAATVTNFVDDFAGRALMPTSQGQVFKKNFTPPGSSVAGSYTFVKVVFKYYFINTWDSNENDVGWAALSKTENCTDLSVGWFSGTTMYVSNGLILATIPINLVRMPTLLTGMHRAAANGQNNGGLKKWLAGIPQAQITQISG